MDRDTYWQFVKSCRESKAQERSIEYLYEHLRHFVNKQERVLLCFLEHKKGNLSWLMEQAVLRCGAVPVVWGPDHRWNTLLRQAFHSRATMIIGAPLVILGLAKLRGYRGTPLSFRKVVTAAYPSTDWMIDGIVKGLDCEVGGCFSPGEDGIVAGFACGHSWGVHVRKDEFGVEIVDDHDNPLPNGELGQIVLYPKSNPAIRCRIGDRARLAEELCACGSSSPRLLDMQLGKTMDPELLELSQYLQKWTSILDCRVEKSESGLEIEIICFPGEKLPKLPTAAKLVVRPFNPKNDEPFWYFPVSGITGTMGQNIKEELL